MPTVETLAIIALVGATYVRLEMLHYKYGKLETKVERLQHELDQVVKATCKHDHDRGIETEKVRKEKIKTKADV